MERASSPADTGRPSRLSPCLVRNFSPVSLFYSFILFLDISWQILPSLPSDRGVLSRSSSPRGIFWETPNTFSLSGGVVGLQDEGCFSPFQGRRKICIESWVNQFLQVRFMFKHVPIPGRFPVTVEATITLHIEGSTPCPLRNQMTKKQFPSRPQNFPTPKPTP